MGDLQIALVGLVATCDVIVILGLSHNDIFSLRFGEKKMARSFHIVWCDARIRFPALSINMVGSICMDSIIRRGEWYLSEERKNQSETGIFLFLPCFCIVEYHLYFLGDQYSFYRRDRG